MAATADRMRVLLCEEELALRHGDAAAVIAFADEKSALIQALANEPIEVADAMDLKAHNRRNGVLARSGLAIMNQIMGSPVGYGPQMHDQPAGRLLNKQA
jgi:hypothetical protein